MWPKRESDSWYSDGVGSYGAIGPVPGASYSLFVLVSSELEGCFSELHWLLIYKLALACVQSLSRKG
jgi:hypothetical protein